ncbi:hypothetical protein K469DRAFT_306393 [Zopfia rhizophila CBS 207.26]|uniref:Uncharacterized protein n=1 Tax=Zopfia rhizophila CBS 207.26 TaxID=1314779 RepID=A0A6A6EKJ9_9PEZI|nr:hypothetical protein K469DRAFT_306393 [Zopfia rhizophila CBS 207.26]
MTLGVLEVPHFSLVQEHLYAARTFHVCPIVLNATVVFQQPWNCKVKAPICDIALACLFVCRTFPACPGSVDNLFIFPQKPATPPPASFLYIFPASDPHWSVQGPASWELKVSAFKWRGKYYVFYNNWAYNLHLSSISFCLAFWPYRVPPLSRCLCHIAEYSWAIFRCVHPRP